MAPAHHAAVRETFHGLNVSTVGAIDGMRKVGSAPAAPRHFAAIDAHGIPPFVEFVYFHSSWSTVRLRLTIIDTVRLRAPRSGVTAFAGLPSRSPPSLTRLACQAVATSELRRGEGWGE